MNWMNCSWFSWIGIWLLCQTINIKVTLEIHHFPGKFRHSCINKDMFSSFTDSPRTPIQHLRSPRHSHIHKHAFCLLLSEQFYWPLCIACVCTMAARQRPLHGIKAMLASSVDSSHPSALSPPQKNIFVFKKQASIHQAIQPNNLKCLAEELVVVPSCFFLLFFSNNLICDNQLPFSAYISTCIFVISRGGDKMHRDHCSTFKA